MSEPFDVLIAGGGLAGLCLARQLRRALPRLSVALVERRRLAALPDACHKVGESSVELASHYFEETLGLASYLREAHLVKNGLRFFPGGGRGPLEDRVEIGPPELPRVRSYQLDRGRFERDLARLALEDGVTVLDGRSIAGVDLAADGGPHRLHLAGGETLRGRWLVDATGRRRLLARHLGLSRGAGHEAHAAWFRVPGRVEPRDLVGAEDRDWHGRDREDIRWLSTNHFMGHGYWVWLIPLATGYTSVGVVVHGEAHAFGRLARRADALAWLREHEPALADFRVQRAYAHGTRQAFGDRWALVGEAAAFPDPLYSPGSDCIAIANHLVTDLVVAERSGRPWEARRDAHEEFFQRFLAGLFETFRHAAPVYARPTVMGAKIVWDNLQYWAFACPWFLQGIHRLPLEDQAPFRAVAGEFQALNEVAQPLLREWALRAEDPPRRRHVLLPPIPSRLATLHLDLALRRTPEETLDAMRRHLEDARDLLADLFFRALSSLPPEEAEGLLGRLDAIGLPEARLSSRIAVEEGGPRGRRRRLPSMARDLERCIGRSPLHPGWGDVSRLRGVIRRAAQRVPAE